MNNSEIITVLIAASSISTATLAGEKKLQDTSITNNTFNAAQLIEKLKAKGLVIKKAETGRSSECDGTGGRDDF